MSLIDEVKKRASGTPASEAAIANAEKIIGYAFPGPLRAVYTNVANGGIGPGYRILGVEGGYLSDEGDSISELYLALSDSDPYDTLWQWPAGTIPFCHWGSGIYSCVDATVDTAPVIWFDPNVREIGEPMEQQFTPHLNSLESWFQGWLNGDDFKPGRSGS